MNRPRIGILFTFRRGWMGGIIYIINLVNNLNYLNDEEQPEIVLFYSPDLSDFLPEFNYPHLTLIEYNPPSLWRAYLGSLLLGRNLFVDKLVRGSNLIGIYPLNDWPVARPNTNDGWRAAAWIPDLQHKFYPQYFGFFRRNFRELRIRWVLRNATDLAVSSGDVESHFSRFYRLKSSLRIHVLRFVSGIDNVVLPPKEALINKYGLPSEYFIVSNQFTNHKNHHVLVRALMRLKERSADSVIVCTGKTDFAGNEAYISSLRKAISEGKLENNFRMLGIIPRADQLGLLKHARAVIQPSLFEGWSTVIEDAKTLSVPVIAADLPVNREQLGRQGIYFDPHDDQQLAQVLNTFEPQPLAFDSFEARAGQFAKDFVSIFTQA